MMGKLQIIRTPSGEEMVVVPRADYEALLAAATDALDDAEDLAIARSRFAEWSETGRLVTPPEVARMILDGRQLLEAFRLHLGLSIDDLATRSGIEATQIRAIESRETTGDTQTLSALADGLGINRLWLDPPETRPDRV